MAFSSAAALDVENDGRSKSESNAVLTFIIIIIADKASL